jgi:hypothetical protein
MLILLKRPGATTLTPSGPIAARIDMDSICLKNSPVKSPTVPWKPSPDGSPGVRTWYPRVISRYLGVASRDLAGMFVYFGVTSTKPRLV